MQKMVTRKSYLFYIFWLSFCQLTFGCSGSSSFAAARNRALGAASLDSEMRAAKCERADFGIYKAAELRQLATLHPDTAVRHIMDGGYATCKFDAADEACSWFSAMTENAVIFNRARFDTVWDPQRFDCTSDRSFPFDDYFLLAGGEDRVGEGTAILETIIPCQLDKGILKFDFWMNNETPVLKVCVVPEDSQIPNCEETKLDVNPLTFEIPGNQHPFRIRIEVDLIGSNDIVLLDNIDYEAQFCEIVNPASEVPKIRTEGNTQAAASENNLAETLPTLPELTLFETTPTAPAEPEGELNQNGLLESESPIPDSRAILPDGGAIPSPVETAVTKNEVPQDKMEACKALVCNFNYDDACFYRLSGLASTAAWQVGKTLVGNPHTGIHKPNPKDNISENDPSKNKPSGFIYVGLDGNDFSNEVFVLESPTFKLRGPAYLFFDVYQRSMGVQLKVCINGFEECPYSNPPLQTSEFWRVDQQVYLRSDAEKVYFLASKVRQNLYLALDNIRLQTIDGQNYCPAAAPSNQHQKFYFD